MPTPSDTFLEQLPLIEQMIRSVCRGRGMNAPDTEEFAAHVKLRMIENDYAIIRKFKGKSTFGTYIATVISRLLNDYRDHEWGRWRNSAEAKRLGQMAMDLERLVVRDTRTLDEAFAELVVLYPTTSREELAELALRFPKRVRRKVISLEESGEPPVTARGRDYADEEMVLLISAVISAFIARLPEEDRLLFHLRFEEDMPVPQIARAHGLDMQSVYRRLRKHFNDLRIALKKAGISDAEVAGLTAQDGAQLDFHLKIGGEDPSNDDEDPDGAPGGSA